MELKKDVFKSKEKVVIKLQAYDFLSKTLSLGKIRLKSLQSHESSDNILEADFNEDSLDITSSLKIPGVYKLILEVSIDGNKKALIFEKYITVTTSFELAKVYCGVSDEKFLDISKLHPVTAQQELPALTAKASSFDVFHLAFQIKPSSYKPHQKFVRFTNRQTQENVVFNSIKDGDSFHLSISLGTESETFSYSSGKYDISILVGDFSSSENIELNIGIIELVFPSKPVKSYPLYTRSLLHTSDNTLKALPEITHKMRPPAKRASLMMSTTFTFLTLLPLVVFVFFTFSLKFTITRLKSVSSILFVSFLVLMLLLYTGYWLGITGFSFYQTIRYICFLVPLIIIFGRSTISDVASYRLDENMREKKDH